MEKVSSYLLAMGVFIIFGYTIVAVWEWAGAAFNRFYHGYIRKIHPEQYMQSVLLPLYGAIVGGLLSTGIAVLVEPPPGNHFSSASLGALLLAAAVLVGVAVPLRARITYESRTKLLIGMRIDRLKDGEWEQDSKATVLRTIEQDKAAIIKRLNDLNSWFLVLLGFLIASDINWLIFHYHRHTLIIIIETWVVVAAASGIAAQLWVWPKASQTALAELEEYRVQADKLSPPISASTTMVYHQYNRDLWVAIGGLIIGAILGRVIDISRRNEH